MKKIIGIFVCTLMIVTAFPAVNSLDDCKTCPTVPSTTQEGTLVAWNQVQKLLASDCSGLDQFGWSVSINGEYALVGSILQGSQPGCNWKGSAYVFKRTGTSTWTQQQQLNASDAAAYNYFGSSVSLDGDRALIGANGRGFTTDTFPGKAYVFKRAASGTWTQQAILKAPDGAANDFFGCSVCLKGNYALVGAGGDDDHGQCSGSAYVFKYTPSTGWAYQKKLVPSDGITYGYFGGSVSMSGDYAIIGADGDDDKGFASGSAYVYKLSTGWAFEKKLLASDGAAYDYFGHSVSMSGDYAIIGAAGHDTGVGSAYVFQYTVPGSWIEETIIPSQTGQQDYFGGSVSIDGNNAIIGADVFSSRRGTAYVFQHIGPGTWTLESQLLASDGAAQDWFGNSVSISGYTAIVGADSNSDCGAGSGSAYVFQKFCCLELKMPKGIYFGRIPITINNVCAQDIVNLGWTITVTGGIQGGVVVTNGNIPLIVPGEGKTVKSNSIFGFGFVTITVDVGCEKRTVQAFVLGPFIYVF